MTPQIIIISILAYFIVLFIISYLTGRKSDNKKFFLAGKNVPWYIIAYGMIGTSISGVTFISIPGLVGAGGVNQAFSYFQMVLGYTLGYFIIAGVLMPIYYKLRLTTIYGYLEQRLGIAAYKTGAGFFLLSRSIGSAFRLYLACIVIQEFVMKPMGIPFWVTVSSILLMIWLFTFKGGMNTVVWTDIIQTTFLTLAVVFTIVFIAHSMNTGLSGLIGQAFDSKYSKIFFWDDIWNDPNHFLKQFISGILIAVVMTGLDQDMMQKNLSCKTLKDARKNMLTFSGIQIAVNFLFLLLGAILYIYADFAHIQMPEKPDQLYPSIVFNYLSVAAAIVFIIGLTSATYSSSDSALTALTTSFCIDFLNFEKIQNQEKKQVRTRHLVHIGFTVLLLLMILLFEIMSDKSVVNRIFEAAGYTYGPILGLFLFAIATRRRLKQKLILPVCLIAPVLSFIINYNSAYLFNGLKIGFMIIALNGALTFMGLMLISKRGETTSLVN